MPGKGAVTEDKPKQLARETAPRPESESELDETLKGDTAQSLF